MIQFEYAASAEEDVGNRLWIAAFFMVCQSEWVSKLYQAFFRSVAVLGIADC